MKEMVMEITKRQREFLEAAAHIAAEQGLSRLTIRNVANALGVTEPAVYRHFTSKKALLEAILDDLQTKVHAHFLTLNNRDQAGTHEKLRAFFAGLFSELDNHPAYAVFIFSEELFYTQPDLKAKLGRVMQENLKSITLSVQDLQEAGVVRDDIPAGELAEIIMGKIRLEITKWHLSEGAYALSDRASLCADMVEQLFSCR
jgi:AcrR family transcriptional regulator